MSADTPSLSGYLLVATPIIDGPPFRRSVIYIGEHDTSGALGVILNSPSRLSVVEVLPELTHLTSDPPVVYLGGPVQTDAAMVLAQSKGCQFAMETTFADIGLVDPANPPADTTALRVYAGFSGWGPGQLEEEIIMGSWWTTEARREDLFASEGVDLWTNAVRRIGGRKLFYLTYPDDPTMN
ncbi:MAG: YqgE/AlgH family protein [Acidimicrobiia bacterium]|nr:YqgE/AlgH family protein [Acidimicrobiia bacterium]